MELPLSPQNAPSDNGVNSRNDSTVQRLGRGVNPEPSPDGNVREGATTRGRGYGVLNAMPVTAPTSAPPEREEIVWTARRLAEVEFKRLGDNNSPQDNETSLRYPWAYLYATVTISAPEEQRNKGRGRLLNLLNQKIDDAGMSIRDQLNIQCLQDQPAAGSKDIASITEIVDEVPTADCNRTTSQGNLARTNTWWRNKATAGGAFTIADMNTMWHDVSDGNDFPTFLLTYQTPFEYYENALVPQIRYSDTRMADAGFQSLKYKNVPVIWDPNIGLTDDIYFINTKYFKLCIDKDWDFRTGDFIEPDNQAAKTAKILWAGNLTCNNMRRQGVLHTITAPS
jgi:hypothetical protein